LSIQIWVYTFALNILPILKIEVLIHVVASFQGTTTWIAIWCTLFETRRVTSREASWAWRRSWPTHL